MPTLDQRIEAARKLDGYTREPWAFETESGDWPDHSLIGGDGDPVLWWDFDLGFRHSAADAALIAAAPDLHRLALDLAAERERLRGLLWYAWHEFNAIRARSGAPLTHDGMTTVAEEWWDQMTEAFEAAIGEDAAKPWPSPEARVALASEPRA